MSEETRAYAIHEKCRGILSNREIMKRVSLAVNGVTVKIHKRRSAKIIGCAEEVATLEDGTKSETAADAEFGRATSVADARL